MNKLHFQNDKASKNDHMISARESLIRYATQMFCQTD